jgi:hypothetical protein
VEEDPFHLQSHPVHDPSDERGNVFVQAHEAVLSFEEERDVDGRQLALWRGKDGHRNELEITTDRCEADDKLHCVESL